MSRWIQRITSTVFSIVAVIAIALSALGLYSLTAYAATQRTQEVGVRMALGAQRSQVAWLFLRQALRQVSIGLAIGMAGAVAVGVALQGALVDVRANDPLDARRRRRIPDAGVRSSPRCCRPGAPRGSIRWRHFDRTNIMRTGWLAAARALRSRSRASAGSTTRSRRTSIC